MRVTRTKEKPVTATAAFWDKIAEKYSRKPVENPDAFDRKTAITRRLMTPDQTVLEVGCGTGSLALRLASTGASIHGLDISMEMVRIARSKADKAGVTNVTFHCGPFDDTFSLFSSESVDGLLAYSILHLLEDVEDGLARMFRLIKAGGYFVSSTVCLGKSKLFYAPMIGVMRLFGKAPLVRFFTADQLIQKIGAAGFADIECPDVGSGATVAFITARKPG
jgi:ubiquinone/menaquinone biosynthesis C-methylase UbiE